MRLHLMIIFLLILSASVHAAAISSAKTGLWSDPTVWNLARAPIAGDDVTINAGHTVTYDSYSTAEINKVTILGTLKFSRTKSTRLDVNHIIINSGISGYLDIGTTTDPIPSTVRTEIFIPVPVDGLFVGGPSFNENDRGIWIDGGTWTVHGAPLRHTWTKLAQTANAGSNKVVIKEDITDWPVGGLVIITSTDTGNTLSQIKDANKNTIGAITRDEERSVVSVVKRADGLYEVTLNETLKYAHLGDPGKAGEIGLLTRNVVIAGKNPRVAGDQPHTRYLNSAQGYLAYAEFRDLGATEVLGRYPIHFHMMDDFSRGMFVKGVSVWRSNNHVMNIHGSDGVLVEDVVAYDIYEQGIYIEKTQCTIPSGAAGCAPPDIPGDNIDNVFIHNLVVKTHAPDPARIGGFWWTAHKNFFIDNVATSTYGGKTSAGFNFDGEAAEPPLAPMMIRNEAHSNRGNGLLAWTNGGRKTTHMVDLYAWRNGYTTGTEAVGSGFSWGAYGNPMSIFNSRFIGNAETGIEHTAAEVHIHDSTIAGEPGVVNTQYGLVAHGYVAVPSPNSPSTIYRNTFSGLAKADISHTHDICDINGDGDDTDPDEIASQNDPDGRNCIPDYIAIAGNTFSTPKPLDFAWHQDRNTWWRLQDNVGLNTGPIPLLPTTPFYVYRADNPAVSGFITTEASTDGITQTKISAVASWWDQPPTIMLTSPTADGTLGSTVILSASASDDKGVQYVMFFADEQLLFNDTTAPYTFTWNTAAWTRSRAYIYARAHDTTGNIAYSAVYKLSRTAAPAPSFDFSLSVPSISVTQGSSVTNTITATLLSGTTQSVSFTVSGLPTGATITTPSSCSPTCASTFTITTATTTPAGSYVITVTGTGGGLTRTTSFTLTVNAPLTFDFSLALSPTSATVTQGVSATTTATITLTLGTTQLVSFSTSGLPTGTTATFSPMSCSPACSSALTISTASITPTGNYAITVTGTSISGIVRSATYTLTVQGLPVLDITPPDVIITYPQASKTVFGTLDFNATATDNVGVSRVEFYIDNSLRRNDTNAPFATNWNTSSYTNTTHTLIARAVDTSGNARNHTISVIVDNGKKIADVNSDGSVNLNDIIIMILAWKSSGSTDINKDGTTDLIDIGILLSKWTG